MSYKLIREIKGWRKLAFGPYLYWQIALSASLSTISVIWVSFNWFVFLFIMGYIFLLLMPHDVCWMLDIVHFTGLDTGYFVFL